MRDFPSCFGENGVQVADASCSSLGVSKPSQNCVTCLYKCKLLGKSCLISIVWSKNLMGQCLSVEIDDASHQCICKVDVKSSLFSKRKGSRSLQLSLRGDASASWGSEERSIQENWSSCFNLQCHLDFQEGTHFWKEATIHASWFVDAKTVMRVNHLQWKFRGNYTILVDGLPVEVFWDVHNWLFGPSLGSAVFMFQTSFSADKCWNSSSLCDSPASSWSCSGSFREAELPGLGFSLVLYAWKNE
ncbi:UNVERIFIED_CONTAM: hypothetical protein Slati_1059700 [Sesamum latifolium]|uniref:Uncharacterized protein n=1 Tax=Sesamum latifolium TaxID=2727402 RepID=A0AAW2XUE9_9LAMI